MPESRDNDDSSFFLTFGRFVGLLSSDLGRACAVVGALFAGFVALNKGWDGNTSTWPYLAVAGATFVGLAFVCRR